MKRIGIMTGGGDCPGLNAVIYGCVHAAHTRNMTLYGIQQNPLHQKAFNLVPLKKEAASHFMLETGGTILGSVVESDLNRHDNKRFKNLESDFSNIAKQLDVLIAVVGDSGIQIIQKLCASNALPFVAVPKTIDNDVFGTTSIGANSVIEYVTQDIDRVHSTGMSHRRIMIVEVMGRDTGFIALNAGIASGANCILIPEIPYNLDTFKKFVKNCYDTTTCSPIIVIAEGLATPSGEHAFLRKYSPDKGRYGGIGYFFNSIIEEELNLPSRCIRLGHLQRGGKPCAKDRLMGILMGEQALELAISGPYHTMVIYQDEHISYCDLKNIKSIKRKVTNIEYWLNKSESLGIYMGHLPKQIPKNPIITRISFKEG